MNVVHAGGPCLALSRLDLLAAVGVGAYPDLAAASRATLKRLRPERPKPAAHRAYDEPYRRYQALYPALKATGQAAGNSFRNE